MATEIMSFSRGDNDKQCDFGGKVSMTLVNQSNITPMLILKGDRIATSDLKSCQIQPWDDCNLGQEGDAYFKDFDPDPE